MIDTELSWIYQGFNWNDDIGKIKAQSSQASNIT